MHEQNYPILWIPSKSTLVDAVNRYETVHGDTRRSSWDDIQGMAFMPKAIYEEPAIEAYMKQRKKIQIELHIRYKPSVLRRPVQMVTVW